MEELVPLNKDMTYKKIFHGFKATDKNGKYYDDYEYCEKLIDVIKKYPINTSNSLDNNRYFLVRYEEVFNMNDIRILRKLVIIEEIKNYEKLLKESKYRIIYNENINVLKSFKI
jgi:hypothetical protein